MATSGTILNRTVGYVTIDAIAATLMMRRRRHPAIVTAAASQVGMGRAGLALSRVGSGPGSSKKVLRLGSSTDWTLGGARWHIGSAPCVWVLIPAPPCKLTSTNTGCVEGPPSSRIRDHPRATICSPGAAREKKWTGHSRFRLDS